MTELAIRIRAAVEAMRRPDPAVVEELLAVAASVERMERCMDEMVGEAMRQSRLTEGWPTRRHLAVGP